MGSSIPGTLKLVEPHKYSGLLLQLNSPKQHKNVSCCQAENTRRRIYEMYICMHIHRCTCTPSHSYSTYNPSTLTFYYNNIVAISVWVCVCKGQCKVKVNVRLTHRPTAGFMFPVTGLQFLYFSGPELKV